MKKSTTEILIELIKIKSFVDSDNTEETIANYIKHFFQKLNKYTIEEQRVEKNRINLIVHDKTTPKIILLGHMDTVLPKNETINPFSPKITGNRLYGLGSLDMKAGLAIMLNQAATNKRKGLAFIFTVDEEYGVKGAAKLVEKYNFKPNIIINIEPTDMEISNECRGVTEFCFVVNGKSAHASRKKLGTNAIEKAVELTNELQRKISLLDKKSSGANTLNLAYLHGGVLKKIDEKNVSEVSGLGVVVPNYAKVNCEIRIATPILTKKLINDYIQKIAKKIGITISSLEFKHYLGSMFTPKESLKSFENILKKAKIPLRYKHVSTVGFYEAQLLQKKWKVNCLIFGPGPSRMAHSANEYVNLDSVSKVESIIDAYIKDIL